MHDVLFSSKNSEWETPTVFFNELCAEFKIVFDLCASDLNKKCVNFLSKNDDSLAQDWNKLSINNDQYAFLNPPYGRKIGEWVKKAYLSSSNELNPINIICLLPARTDTKWFHEYILNKSSIRFIKGRIKFSNASHNAPFPSMLVIYNSNAIFDK